MNEAEALAAAARETAQARAAVAAATPKPAAAGTVAAASPRVWWTTQNAMTMCGLLLAFSLVVLLLATYLIRIGKSAVSVLQIFGTILVITMATFLVVAGYTDQQVSAPLGLLGTVAGYLLGRGSGDRAGPAGAATDDRQG